MSAAAGSGGRRAAADPDLAGTVADLAGAPGITWGVCVRDVADGGVLASVAPDRSLPIASLGKLLLLVEVAAQLDEGALDPGLRLSRRPECAVADSGLWQHLATDALPVTDLAVMVAAVSDNLATNVLLAHVGLPAVQRRGAVLGLEATRLLDRVRDERGDDVPSTLASGTAAELSELTARLASGTAVSAIPDATVLEWLGLGTDLSLVGSAFGLDPLAHRQADRGVVLRSKTGTEAGIRADAGVVDGGGRRLAYAALARWDPGDDALRDVVLEGMFRLGAALRAALGCEPVHPT